MTTTDNTTSSADGLDPIRQQIIYLVDRWRSPLGLNGWRLDVNLDWMHDSHRLAQTAVNWPYMTAAMDFNVYALQHLPAERFEEVVVHELMHILLAEVGNEEEYDPHEERVATMLARAFLAVIVDLAVVCEDTDTHAEALASAADTDQPALPHTPNSGAPFTH